MYSRQSGKGFSLLEVLIALVVLSIGMMGVAAMFVDSLRNSGSAIYRTRAVIYAQDMADRIRANQSAAASYVAAVADTGTDNGCADSGETGSVVAAVQCTAAQMAAHDIFTWKQIIEDGQTGLPGGEASIARNAGTVPATYTITVQWTEQDEDLNYVLTFQK